MNKKFYTTTAIAYVNAAPHIGYALELIQTDALARYHRLIGDDTYFLTGTDEHGVKIYETATEAGKKTQDFVDENAAKFQALKKILNLSNDGFVRTTSEAHKKAAQKLWMKMFEAGDIYKDTYQGNYCVGCESFIPDKDLDENGMCPIHKKKPKVLSEENYFFRLSKYSDKIRDLIEKNELQVLPESRKNEILNIIGEGLKDVSFSRPKNVLPWGISVPNDDSQVMYVWCDALSNYITAIDYLNEGEQFQKYWPADCHIIGKDILRFHAGIWPGMLLSAGVKLPKAIYVHGFITSEGQKMSKSIGNVIDPLEYVDKYGVDALRYYLLREIPTTDDGDFSHARFLDLHNSELANNLGNLLNRVVMMVDRYLGGKVPKVYEDGEMTAKILEIVKAYHVAFARFDLKNACEKIVELLTLGNKYIDDQKPWVLAKENPEKLAEVLYLLLELLRYASFLIYPILPESALKMAAQLGLSEIVYDEKWGGFKEGHQIMKGDPLFPRLEN